MAEQHKHCIKRQKFAWHKYFELYRESHKEYYEMSLKYKQLLLKDTQMSNYTKNVIQELYKKAQENIECQVCFDEITPEAFDIRFCGHIFHKECLLKWLEQNKKTCPICRQ